MSFLVLVNFWISDHRENDYVFYWLHQWLAAITKIGKGFYCKKFLTEVMFAIDEVILEKWNK